MKFRQALFMLPVIAILLVAWWLHADGYRRTIEAELRGNVQQIKFKPHVDREWVQVTDADAIKAIAQVIQQAKAPPMLASHPLTTCAMMMEFDDGSEVHLNISPLGITASNFFHQHALAHEPLSYVMLSWNGYLRVAQSKPFAEVLRKHEIARAQGRSLNQTSDESAGPPIQASP